MTRGTRTVTQRRSFSRDCSLSRGACRLLCVLGKAGSWLEPPTTSVGVTQARMATTIAAARAETSQGGSAPIRFGRRRWPNLDPVGQPSGHPRWKSTQRVPSGSRARSQPRPKVEQALRRAGRISPDQDAVQGACHSDPPSAHLPPLPNLVRQGPDFCTRLQSVVVKRSMGGWGSTRPRT